MANIHYIRQKKPLGLGNAIMYAESFVANEPFLVLLGDDIMYTQNDPVSLQLIKKYNEIGSGNILGVQKVPRKEVDKYGIIDYTDKFDDKTYIVDNFIEKPEVENAPSQYAALGRYILEPEIFEYLKKTEIGKKGEYELTDAILKMRKESDKKLYAYEFDALRYDVGDKFGMFKATVEFGLRHPELKDKVKLYLLDLIDKIK